MCTTFVFRRGFNRIQHGITYAQTLGPSLINWDVICFVRLLGRMQHDRLKSTPRVLRAIVSGACGWTSLQLPGIKAKQTDRPGMPLHACLPTETQMILFSMYSQVILWRSCQSMGKLMGGKPVYKDTEHGNTPRTA